MRAQPLLQPVTHQRDVLLQLARVGGQLQLRARRALARLPVIVSLLVYIRHQDTDGRPRGASVRGWTVLARAFSS